MQMHQSAKEKRQVAIGCCRLSSTRRRGHSHERRPARAHATNLMPVLHAEVLDLDLPVALLHEPQRPPARPAEAVTSGGYLFLAVWVLALWLGGQHERHGLRAAVPPHTNGGLIANSCSERLARGGLARAVRKAMALEIGI